MVIVVRSREKTPNIIIINITDPFSQIVAAVAILLDIFNDEDVSGETGRFCGGNMRLFIWYKMLIYL